MGGFADQSRMIPHRYPKSCFLNTRDSFVTQSHKISDGIVDSQFVNTFPGVGQGAIRLSFCDLAVGHFDFHFLKIYSLLSGWHFKFSGLTLPCQFFVPNFGKIVSDFWPSGTRLQPSPAVLPIPISFSRSRPITRLACATRPCTATAVCLHGSAHDGLTGDSRACQRYVQIVVPIPFPIPISCSRSYSYSDSVSIPRYIPIPIPVSISVPVWMPVTPTKSTDPISTFAKKMQ